MTAFRSAILFCILVLSVSAQSINLLSNVENRQKQDLNGQWKIIIDPYETGYYNYRYQPRTDGYFENRKPKDKSELVEYNFDTSEELTVPGDWNTQKEKLFLYEGTIWYKKSFQHKKKNNTRTFLYFGAVNYEAIVYVNGKKLGEHVGGFTPFNFEATNELVDGENFVVVKVDNKRKREGVPTLNTDWWNYGGITRDVYLIDVHETFIKDYFLQLKKNSLNDISGWIQLEGKEKFQEITIEIPEAKKSIKVKTNENGFAEIRFSVDLKLWSPENPKTYSIKIFSQTDSLEDKIGFRSIETKGNEIFLNGRSIFLRGISIHEEAPFGGGRANSEKDTDTLLSWAKQLGCNYVRLAHYPHNENMIRKAEELGLLIWAEIPVYWTILWENKDVLANAENQLKEMITRDKNRAPIIIWSVANETPVGEARYNFLHHLIKTAKELDPTRLITAATEIHSEINVITLSDSLSNLLDGIGVNEYIGWYGGTAEDAPKTSWESKFNKPLIISEFGADAKYNFHGDPHARFTEEYQSNIYINQIEMLRKIPFLRGMSPWILTDFHSPRRPLSGIQDMYNRKGLISDKGEKKQAFYVLKNFYNEKAK
ncbi:MAG: glycoside hydrolase family 2 TIM barrel-domain containing protein [Ignavibacteriaceae bacterium]|jgi:beta-glucuronidase